MFFRILFVCLGVMLSHSLLDAQVKKKIAYYELDIIKGLYFQPNTIDPYTGTAFEIHPNGNRQMEVHIKDGKLNGKVKEWDRGGEKVYEAEYENGVQIGKEQQWYNDGFQKLHVAYKDGLANGVCTEWHQSGGKKSLGEFVNGNEVGEHNWWYATGKKDQTVNFKNGKEEGKMMAWHENGVQKIDANYNNGKLEGDYLLWYSNGQKKSVEKFRDSLHVGEALYWAVDGRLIGRDIYSNDGVLKESHNYNSGSIKVEADHYVQVFNTKNSHFLVDMETDDKIYFVDGADDITYSMDGMLLQLFTFPAAKYKASNPKDKFEAFLSDEKKFIEENVDTEISIRQETKQSGTGISFYYWHFMSPSSKLSEQKPRTVQSEHYITFICSDQILSLYSVVTNSDEPADIKKLLFKVADTFLCLEEPIDLNEVRRERQ